MYALDQVTRKSWFFHKNNYYYMSGAQVLLGSSFRDNSFYSTPRSAWSKEFSVEIKRIYTFPINYDFCENINKLFLTHVNL